ncbi:MAG: outer membrane beta-barrel protein [Myxococcota bacterium]
MNVKLCISSFVVFLLAAMAFPATAFAQDDFPLTISVGLKGGVNMQGGAEVPDLTPEQMREYNLNTSYPQSEDSGVYGHFGAGPAVGGFLEVRILEMLGLETGLFWAQDNATGWEDKLVNGQEQGRVSHDLEVTALHIPLLFKANVKSETIKPFVGIGPEFVIQQSSSITYRADNDASQYPQRFVDGRNGQPGFDERIKTETSNYVLLQLNFGMEVDLGEVRIPFEIRTGFNPGFGGDDFDERMSAEPREDGFFDFVYDSKYLGHVGIYTGIAYDFEMNL